MIFSKFLLNKKYADIRTVIALILAARIILNFQIYDQPRANNFTGSSVNTSIEASKDFIHFNGSIQRNDNQNKPAQGNYFLTHCDQASVKPAKMIFSVFRSSVLSLINYSAFLSSHFSTDT